MVPPMPTDDGPETRTYGPVGWGSTTDSGVGGPAGPARGPGDRGVAGTNRWGPTTPRGRGAVGRWRRPGLLKGGGSRRCPRTTGRRPARTDRWAGGARRIGAWWRPPSPARW